MFLEIHDLRKGFGEGENRTEVLKGISFEVERGEICVLLGPSGSGKSTLLKEGSIMRMRDMLLLTESELQTCLRKY